MAYLSNQQDLEENAQGMNDPNKQGQEMRNQSQSQGQMGGPQQVAAPTSQPSSQVKAPSAPKATKAVGSGMFTNLNKYISQNQPKVQQMGQDISKNIQGQVQKVQSQANQQQQLFNQQISEQQAKMNDQANKTQSTTSNITNTYNPNEYNQYGEQVNPPTSPISVDDVEYQRIRDILEGKTRYNTVEELNLADQMNKAQELQRLGAGATTEEGRRALLRNVYSPSAQYTAGKQKLDDFLLKGTGQATQLAQSLGSSTKANQQALEEISRKSAKDLASFNLEESGFRQKITDILTGGAKTVDQQLQERVDTLINNRKELAKKLGISEDAITEYADQLAKEVKTTYGDLSKEVGYGGFYGNQSATTGQYSPKDVIAANAQLQDIKGRQLGLINQGGASRENVIKAINDMSGSTNLTDSNLRLLGLSRDDVGQYGKDAGYSDDSFLKDGKTVKAFADYQDKVTKLNLNEIGDVLNEYKKRYGAVEGSKRAAEMFGDLGYSSKNYENYKKGKDINTQSSATKSDVERYNALQDLLHGKNMGERALKSEDKKIGSGYAKQRELNELRKEIYKGLKETGRTFKKHEQANKDLAPKKQNKPKNL